MPGRPIRTLVIDDSVFMRSVLKSAMEKAPSIEVIGSAQNGTEGFRKIKDLSPDVVTLDIEMPGMTGLEVLEAVMTDRPMPIVMVSTKTQKGAEMTFRALELGAVDYVAKPLEDKAIPTGGSISKRASLQQFQQDVIKAVESAFRVNRSLIGRPDKTRILTPRHAAIRTDGVVAIGISAGGPATLHKLLPVLPAEFPPIVLTQHMPADFTGPFAQRLNGGAKLTVKEAEAGDELVPGRLLIAPGDRHLMVGMRGRKRVAVLDSGPKVSGFRPSVDVLFESVGSVFGAHAIGLVMTGMGCDGAVGIKMLHEAGAKTLSQDQESSIVYGMPKAAFETGCIDQVVTLAEIPDVLVRLLKQAAKQPA
ncbi:MAG: chemotaxis response regulator protein-glutamate methylesterase [Phycisphaerae bacterium]